MSDRALAIIDPEDDEDEPEAVDRERDLLGNRPRRDQDGNQQPGTPIRRRLDELFTTVHKGFEDQKERSDAQEDYWDCYNCDANGNRYYNGIADIYFPIVHDAVEALVTRWVNQMFPAAGRYVEVIAADGTQAAAYRSLLDHYIRERKFKTMIAEPLVRNGIIEGQVNLYTDWAEVRRQIVSRETHAPRDPQTGIEGAGEEIDDIKEEDIIEGFPVYEVLHDSDVLVFPPTADTIDEALAAGGGCAIARRWTKATIDKLAEAGTIRTDEAKSLKDEMKRMEAGSNIERHLLEAVGIHPGGKQCTVWEVWTMLPLSDKGTYSEKGEDRLCRVFLGPHRAQLGAKRNPYWNDRCPVHSIPLKKMAGVFKGPSLISYVDSLQYEANDAANEGADAATLSAMPIIMRDTAKGNGPLVLNQAAIWDYPKDAINVLAFPDLTPRAATRVQLAIQAIFQAMGVNPSMLPQQTRTGKPSQAQIAQEQQVDLLTTAMAVTVLEEGIFTPAMAWTVDLDYQFRDRNLSVRMFGEMGKQAEMQEIAPLQNRHGFTFIWRGGTQARQNANMMQQGTAWLNVMQTPGVQQALTANGYKWNPVPIIQSQTDTIFGPELGQLTIIDQREQLSWDPEEENAALIAGFEVPVHPFDDDMRHMQSHMQALQQQGDPHQTLQIHLQNHMKQRQAKTIQALIAAQQQAMGQQLGGPGPQPAQGPQGAGAPQPGAVPAQPRGLKQAPGAIHPDQQPRAGAVLMPRKFG